MEAPALPAERLALANEAGAFLDAAGELVPGPVEVWIAWTVALDRLGYAPAAILALMRRPELRQLLYAGDWTGAGFDAGPLLRDLGRPAAAARVNRNRVPPTSR